MLLEINGEINPETQNFLFSYEKLGASAVGKTHSVSVRINRIHNVEIVGTEHITIVIRIVKPYTEIFLIDVEISNKLITFSDADVEKFEIDFSSCICRNGYICNGTGDQL